MDVNQSIKQASKHTSFILVHKLSSVLFCSSTYFGVHFRFDSFGHRIGWCEKNIPNIVIQIIKRGFFVLQGAIVKASSTIVGLVFGAETLIAAQGIIPYFVYEGGGPTPIGDQRICR